MQRREPRRSFYVTDRAKQRACMARDHQVSSVGTILSWNPGAKRIFDYTAEEAVETSYHRPFGEPPAIDDQTETPTETCTETEASVTEV